MNCFKKKSVYYFSMCCASNARQLQYSLTVTTGARPGVDYVQVTFTPHLSALQEVFSD